MTPLRIVRRAILCCVALCGLMLGGCGSSRSSVKGSQGRIVNNERRQKSGHAKPATPPKPINIAKIADPMVRDLVSEANRWLGTPYNYGGETMAGTDCSGLVMSVYRDVTGVKIPRTTREQIRYCTNVARNHIRPGDLVFFASDKEVSHVGLYVGNGAMIHASSSRGVVVSDIDNGYWGDRYITGGRVDSAPESWAALNRSKSGTRQPEPAIPASIQEAPANLLRNHGEMAVAPTPTYDVTTAAATPVSGEPVSEIDLLDLIITQKTDSIFASQFLD